MKLENQISEAIWSLQELEKLKETLRIDDFLFNYIASKIWYKLQSMRSELQLADQTPVNELVWLFKRLEEIREVFDLQDSDYKQLNDLLIEITMIKQILNLADNIPLPEVLHRINIEMFPLLGLTTDSLLAKLILFSRIK